MTATAALYLLIFYAPAPSPMSLEMLALDMEMEAWASPLWRDQIDAYDARVRAASEMESRGMSDEPEEPDEPEAPAPAVAAPEAPKPKPVAKTEAERLCVSIGKPNRGWLGSGVKLTDTEQIISRRRNAYGTPEMVGSIKRAAAAVFARFPDSHRLVVGDLSKKSGGPFPPHKSHQSGRDVDIAYYVKVKEQPERLQAVSPRRLDAARTWVFLRALLEDEAVGVKYMFINYELQRPLYKYAKDVDKVPEDKLKLWFSYPRGKRSHAGIIRHLKGHHTHVHVRFNSPIAVGNLAAYVKKHGNKAIRPLPVYYKIRRGDSLYKIARRKRVRIKDLTKWNRIRRRKTLRPGQKLIVGWRRPRLPGS